MLDLPASFPLQSPKLGRRPGLDGLRGVAIGVVLLYHAVTDGGLRTSLMSGGFLGVDLFFVLSGFLISTLLFEEFAQRQKISFIGFYKRRFFRLAPALVSVALFVLAVALIQNQLGPALQWAWLALTYQTNLSIASGHPLPIYPATWSLAMEEQFYLVVPLLLLLAMRYLSPKALLCLTCSLILAVASWRVFLTVQEAPLARLYFAPDTRFDSLLAGVLAAQVWRFTSWRPTGKQAFYAAVFFTTMVFLAGTNYRWIYLFLFTPLAVACGLVILWAVENKGIFHFRPLVWLGGISYAAYLWHEPLFFAVNPNGNLLKVLIALGLTLLVSSISRSVLEQPAIRWGKNRRFFRPRPEQRNLPECPPPPSQGPNSSEKALSSAISPPR